MLEAGRGGERLEADGASAWQITRALTNGGKLDICTHLRELIRDGCVAMPGVLNASMGRMVERAGFRCGLHQRRGLVQCTAGVPDIGLLTLKEVAQLAGFIARAVKIPAIVDADTGFGGAENAARTIEELERAGSGRLPSGRSGISETLRTSRGQDVGRGRRHESRKSRPRWRRSAIPIFSLIARTDARAVENFDQAVERAQAYLAAGADAIFPEALQTSEEFRDFAKEVKCRCSRT